MNILIIALKNIRQNLKRPLTLILLVALPVMLIWILGLAFDGLISADPELPAVKLGYHSAEGWPGSIFREYLSGITGLELSAEEVADPAAGRERVVRGELHALVSMPREAGEVEIVFADAGSLEAVVLKNLLQDFVSRLNVFSLQQRHGIPAALTAAPDYIDFTPVPRSRQPGSIDYFGIMIPIMLILWGSFVGAYGINAERNLHTLDRIYTAPVRKLEVFLGICLGALFSLVIQVTVVLLAGKFLLGVYYGESFLLPGVLLFCECFFALSLGVGMAALLKDEKAVSGLLNPLVHVLIFLGGGYVKYPEEGVLKILSRFSPMTWVNKAMFAEIYPGGSDYFLPAVIICLGAGALMLFLAAGRMLKRSLI